MGYFQCLLLALLLENRGDLNLWSKLVWACAHYLLGNYTVETSALALAGTMLCWHAACVHTQANFLVNRGI